MCLYTFFRNKANATFPGLIVSVLMFEKGSGKAIPVTMYRVKVAGMAIGEDLASEGASVDDVLSALVRKVCAARRAKKDADNARALARRAAANGGQTVQMVMRAGGAAAGAEAGDEQPLKLAA